MIVIIMIPPGEFHLYQNLDLFSNSAAREALPLFDELYSIEQFVAMNNL